MKSFRTHYQLSKNNSPRVNNMANVTQNYDIHMGKVNRIHGHMDRDKPIQLEVITHPYTAAHSLSIIIVRRTHTHARTYTHTHTHAHMHAHTYTRTHTRTHIHTHRHTH